MRFFHLRTTGLFRKRKQVSKTMRAFAIALEEQVRG
jgi:hypothetical protein